MWDAITLLNNSRKRNATVNGRTLSREWDTSAWKQVDHPLAGTLIASASSDSHVRLRRLSDRRTIATFQHSVSVPKDASRHQLHVFVDPPPLWRLISRHSAAKAQVSHSKIFSIDAKSVTIQPSLILNSTSGTIFAHRSKAKLEKILWEDALLDAQKVIELEPSSHVGYHLKHTALRGARRYREAVDAFQMMHAKLASAHSMQIRKLRETYVSPSKAEGAIRKVINDHLDTAPHRLLATATGLLCDREAQISAFKTSTEYNELLLSIMMHPDLPIEHIAEAVATYFRYVMLSHRWGDNEPLLHDIQDKIVYKLKAAGGLVKLQSFCKLARRTGFHWAWVDSCCIDQNNHVELQKSLNSTFAWYRQSALTVVYLSDVPPSSKSGALAKSDWNTRGWTVPEFLAPQFIRFYQQDWTPYLDDHSPNHKESVEIMDELEDATGIDARALVTFQPGMRDAREKLRWASMRVTTIPEDIAYSLFGIFGTQLPILYGENRQNALGRLLQEIVARSGDITALDWVGQPPEFNSCLPADITSYAAPPCLLPSLSEDEIQTAVSSLQQVVAADSVSKFHDRLEQLKAPRFANCRLRLPCMTFRVTEVRRRSGPPQETIFTYRIKADGLDDLLLTTEEKLIQFWRERPIRQTFLLVRPWDRRLLELPDFADDAESLGGWSEPESLLDDSDESDGDSLGKEELADSESHSRGLRLIVRLGQPFAVFLLSQQRGGEYKRIASDHDIIAQVKDVSSVHSMMDIRTLEIL
ncbi:heterokaryon incompatibility protein-domain-containing protein [Suillus lakei]|nr:heterokaryon incompatibility protein-domain-containing protein [Suillus lakei]